MQPLKLPLSIYIKSAHLNATKSSFLLVNPPIREQYHQEHLWKAVKNNEVAVLGSDHAPHTKKEEKSQAYPASPSGIQGSNNFSPYA